MDPVGSSFIPSPVISYLTISQAAALRAIWPVICEQHPYIPAFETPQQMLAWLDHPLSNLNIIHVKSLNLIDLELTELPSALMKFHHLTELDLSGNELKTLPNSIAQLSLLRVLKLQDNQFTQLPAAMGNLSKLETLFIDGNPNLHQLPPELYNLPILTFYCDRDLYNAIPHNAPILEGYYSSHGESMNGSSEGSGSEDADYAQSYFD